MVRKEKKKSYLKANALPAIKTFSFFQPPPTISLSFFQPPPLFHPPSIRDLRLEISCFSL